ncbi:MAG: CBS domain-containing protein [Pseudomonadota bacterium]
MTTLREMLEIKGNQVWSIETSATVFRAIELMAEHEVGALPVVDENGKLAGIISERDYARKVILKMRASRDTPVTAIMTSNVITVTEDDSVDRCMALMERHRIRHLPVVDGDDLVGIVAVGDVLKFIIREQTAAIAELESYVLDETGGSG